MLILTELYLFSGVALSESSQATLYTECTMLPSRHTRYALGLVGRVLWREPISLIQSESAREAKGALDAE